MTPTLDGRCQTRIFFVLFALGPIKIILIRWRFNGGRIFW